MAELIMTLRKAVLPPIPAIMAIGWMEQPTELARLMRHGVAMTLHAHVCT